MSTQPLKKLILSDKASITSQHTTSLIHDNYEVLSSQHLKKPPKHQPQKSRRQELRQQIEEQFEVFSELYDFNYKMRIDGSIACPCEADVYEYCRYVTVSCKMENEIPIICLVYLERLITKTGILLTVENWKRLTLIALCLGSKIWDDDSLENVHFPKVMGDVTLKMINRLEETFLEFIDFDLVIKGSEYAKYYFILRSLQSEIKLETPQLFKAKAPL